MKNHSNSFDDVVNNFVLTEEVYTYNFDSQEFNTLIALKLPSEYNVQEELDELTNYLESEYGIENLKYMAVLDFNPTYRDENCDCILLFTNINREKSNYIIENYNHEFSIHFFPYNMINFFLDVWMNSVKTCRNRNKVTFDKNLAYPPIK